MGDGLVVSPAVEGDHTELNERPRVVGERAEHSGGAIQLSGVHQGAAQTEAKIAGIGIDPDRRLQCGAGGFPVLTPGLQVRNRGPGVDIAGIEFRRPFEGGARLVDAPEQPQGNAEQPVRFRAPGPIHDLGTKGGHRSFVVFAGKRLLTGPQRFTPCRRGHGRSGRHPPQGDRPHAGRDARPDSHRLLMRLETVATQHQSVFPEPNLHPDEVPLIVRSEIDRPVDSSEERELNLHPGQGLRLPVQHPTTKAAVLRRDRQRQQAAEHQEDGGPAGGPSPAGAASGVAQKVNRAPSCISRGG